MDHYAGIDVSLEQSSVCVIDRHGRIVREAKLASEPEALIIFFRELSVQLTRIGLEAGPLSQWLHAGLAGAGFDVVLLETRQVKAALSAMVVKTDRPSRLPGSLDPLRGPDRSRRERWTPAASPSCWSMAPSSTGWFRPVPCKSPPAQEIRAPLVGRKLLQGKLLDVELSIRGILRGFGLKAGPVSQGRFAARIQELIGGQPMLERVIEPMLRAREALYKEFHALHRVQDTDLADAQTDRLAIALGADRLDRRGDVGPEPALGVGPAAQAAQRFQAPVHGRRAQMALPDQVLPIGDELELAQRREIIAATLPAQKLADILEVTIDRGWGEIGAHQAGPEAGQPGMVGVRRRRLCFPQYHPPRSGLDYGGKDRCRTGRKTGNSTPDYPDHASGSGPANLELSPMSRPAVATLMHRAEIVARRQSARDPVGEPAAANASEG